MDIQKTLESLSPTDLNRELDVANILLREASYSTSLSKIQIPLKTFEGKHFRDFAQDELVKVVSGILNKLNIVKTYSHTPKGFVVNLTNYVNKLQEYKKIIENELQKVELSKTKRWSYFEDATFYIELVSGVKKQVNFDTQRGKPYMLLLFNLLFNQYKNHPDAYISTQKIQNILEKTHGIKDKPVDFVKSNIGNLRKKIRSAQLEDYVEIESVRDKGYKLTIKRV